MDPITILAALAPLGVDLGKALIQRFASTEFTPKTIDEYVQMRTLELDMFKALNDAGGTNATYLWVEAIVRLQRPIVAAIVLATWSFAHITNQADTASIDNFASAIGFYLFGDRTLFHVKKALK
jgi:hypothetical protein